MEDVKAGKEAEGIFLTIARHILGRCSMDVGRGRRYRIVEVEFYVRSPSHADPYTHGHPRQARVGWYVHRLSPKEGATPKEGTYRGIDIALGSEGVCCGVLVRTIRDVASGEVISGPCLVVNEILRCVSLETARELAERLEGEGLDHPGTLSLVYGEDDDLCEDVVCSPRVGLSGKHPEWRWLPYRYVDARYVSHIKKGWDLIVAHALLHHEGTGAHTARRVKLVEEVRERVARGEEVKGDVAGYVAWHTR